MTYQLAVGEGSVEAVGLHDVSAHQLHLMGRCVDEGTQVADVVLVVRVAHHGTHTISVLSQDLHHMTAQIPRSAGDANSLALARNRRIGVLGTFHGFFTHGHSPPAAACSHARVEHTSSVSRCQEVARGAI